MELVGDGPFEQRIEAAVEGRLLTADRGGRAAFRGEGAARRPSYRCAGGWIKHSLSSEGNRRFRLKHSQQPTDRHDGKHQRQAVDRTDHPARGCPGPRFVLDLSWSSSPLVRSSRRFPRDAYRIAWGSSRLAYGQHTFRLHLGARPGPDAPATDSSPLGVIPGSFVTKL